MRDSGAKVMCNFLKYGQFVYNLLNNVSFVSLLNPLSAVTSFPGGMMHNIAVLEQHSNVCIRHKLCFPVTFHWKRKSFFFLSVLNLSCFIIDCMI